MIRSMSSALALSLVIAHASRDAHAQWVTPAVDAPGVEQHIFQSAAADTAVSYHIFLPPEYDESDCRRFPVLYWLHGANAGVQGIVPLSGFFRTAMADGLIPPMLVVFPNGLAYSMWSDSVHGSVPMESIVIGELLPEIDGRFRKVPG